MKTVEQRPAGETPPESPLDQRPNGGFTYRQLNEMYMAMGARKGFEDGHEVTVYSEALFVEKTEPTEADLKRRKALKQLNRDFLARWQNLAAQIERGVPLEDI